MKYYKCQIYYPSPYLATVIAASGPLTRLQACWLLQRYVLETGNVEFLQGTTISQVVKKHLKMEPYLPVVSATKQAVNSEIKNLFFSPPREECCGNRCCLPVFQRAGEGFYEYQADFNQKVRSFAQK